MEWDGMWTDEVDRLIERLELRLEQYRLHADALLRGSRDHEGALALIGRIEGRLDGLYEWRKKQGESHGTVSAHIAAGRLANSDRGRDSNND
jgi:hypothetical protein